MESAQRAYDNMMPDEDEFECPECGGGDCKEDRYSIECLECGWSSEADLEAILEAKNG